MVIRFSDVVKNESEDVKRYFNELDKKREEIEEKGRFERALKSGELEEMMKLEGICARKALGVAELVDEEDPKKAEKYRTAAAYCLENMGRIALRTGNNVAAAAYLKSASDAIYQGLQHRQHGGEIEQARNRMLGRKDNADGEEYEQEPRKRQHEHRYGLSAIMVGAGIAVLVLAGMPQITGGVIGVGSTEILNVVGVIGILLGIGLLWTRRKIIK